MSAAVVLVPPPPAYRPREYHAFESAGAKFLYLVPSGAIFSLDTIGREILECVSEASRTREEVLAILLARGYDKREAITALVELEQSDVIQHGDAVPVVAKVPEKAFPLQRIVLNVTNQC